MSSHAISLLTAEQYLEMERTSEFRSEYVNGQVSAMSGGAIEPRAHCAEHPLEALRAIKRTALRSLRE